MTAPTPPARPAALAPTAAERRWFRLAAIGLAAHAIDHWRTRRHPGRVAELAGLAALSVTFQRLPPSRRGVLALALGAGPTYGAFAGHLVPLARGRYLPGSATGPLNLLGGVILLTLGARLLRADPHHQQR